MTPEQAQWLNAELDHFHRAKPDERAVILRDVQNLAKSQNPETADWNSALLEYLQNQSLPVAAHQNHKAGPVTWEQTGQVTLTLVKIATPPAVIAGGGYLLVSALAGVKVWLLANGGIIAAIVGCFGALWAVSGLFPDKKTEQAKQNGTSGTSAGADGGKTIIQQFFITGDGNTVVNNGEIK